MQEKPPWQSNISPNIPQTNHSASLLRNIRPNEDNFMNMPKRKPLPLVSRISFLATAAIMLLAEATIVCGDRPARAESEASSEAGLEAPTYARRRSRRLYRQQVRQERAHERQVRVHQEKTDSKLANRPTRDFVHNYGSRRHGRRQQSQTGSPQTQAQPTQK